MKPKIKNKQGEKFFERGFSLLEALFALLIIVVGVSGSFALINQTLSFSSFSSNKLIAVYLAQEGLEVVRNIRDNNWIQKEEWSDSLSPAGDPKGQISYTSTRANENYDDCYLSIDGDGFYYQPNKNKQTGLCEGSNPTKFKRLIEISKAQGGDFEPMTDNSETRVVKATVEWQEKGRTHNLTVEETLWNWYWDGIKEGIEPPVAGAGEDKGKGKTK